MPKNIYFTTRPWGFGSNIVNFLKSAAYCAYNNYDLIFQDRNNSISEDFKLFSPINLRNNIIRNKMVKTYPIYNWKTYLKFLINDQFSVNIRIKYAVFYIFNFEADIFMKNFNFNNKINSSFFKNISIYRGAFLNTLWSYNEETFKIFKGLDLKYDLIDYKPDISIQIRGGDKINERTEQGHQGNIIIDNYLRYLLKELSLINKDIPKIYIMTDTYSYYTSIAEKVLTLYPNAELKTLANNQQQGYHQEIFNELSVNEKIESYYFFLYEIEFLRKSKTCIGSFTSNIFYLTYLIPYLIESKFVSVDSTLENSFL